MAVRGTSDEASAALERAEAAVAAEARAAQQVLVELRWQRVEVWREAGGEAAERELQERCKLLGHRLAEAREELRGLQAAKHKLLADAAQLRSARQAAAAEVAAASERRQAQATLLASREGAAQSLLRLSAAAQRLLLGNKAAQQAAQERAVLAAAVQASVAALAAARQRSGDVEARCVQLDASLSGNASDTAQLAERLNSLARELEQCASTADEAPGGPAARGPAAAGVAPAKVEPKSPNPYGLPPAPAGKEGCAPPPLRWVGAAPCPA
jgi:chromosome segregation ATPase